ncbi:hypothetical protein HPB47_017199 [Ixodes persulcatus]|uniref:Uncharacterized protein n=1 Tax=Ixodes persulcatus TaxID=34615 RepID=A0AC60QNX2_IXOPE|nr:hypothetical protein HPB47_017199 [Ixodes persulcatus]
MARSQLAEYTAKSTKLFYMVEDPTFVDLMSYCDPKWNIPRGGNFANMAIPALETTIMEALNKELKECIRKVHLPTDIRSSHQVNNFMSVMKHCVILNSKGRLARKNAVHDMSKLGQQHTAYNIGQKLNDVPSKSLVPLVLEVATVTSDNAQNVKALNDRGMKHVPCMAHCFNLVKKASLIKSGVEVKETIKAACAIVSHF